MGIFDKIKTGSKKNGIPKLVSGINQVDNLGEWDNDINQPTPETEAKIKERANDIIEKLTSGNHGASRDQIEYFSALRAYRLPQVINKIIHCTGVITTFKPKEITDPDCSEGMSDENRKEINAMLQQSRAKSKSMGLDTFIVELLSKVDDSQKKELQKIIKEKKEKPINVAIIGQSGVGKSTTVNNLFGAKERTSRVGEGTNVHNYGGYKEYYLEDGSVMRVADLPGYGRGLGEDEAYKPMYINALKNCDVILLIIQANDKAIADDQYMVECLYEWSKEGLLTNDEMYYGQETGLNENFTVKEILENKRDDSLTSEVSNPHFEVKTDYLAEIENLCRKALNDLEPNTEEYKKIKAIFKSL